MNETTEFWRDLRHEGQKKRATNRERGAALLAERGFSFASKNDGAHLIITHARKTADYWPGPGRWAIRGGITGYGVFGLMRLLEQE